jgi:hypothetical protein
LLGGGGGGGRKHGIFDFTTSNPDGR